VRFPVVIRPAEEGGFVVSCPVVPGCHAQGETCAEALANVREVILLALECREQEGW
jgi:predicted RNase H-like HicB family nuclease